MARPSTEPPSTIAAPYAARVTLTGSRSEETRVMSTSSAQPTHYTRTPAAHLLAVTFPKNNLGSAVSSSCVSAAATPATAPSARAITADMSVLGVDTSVDMKTMRG